MASFMGNGIDWKTAGVFYSLTRVEQTRVGSLQDGFRKGGRRNFRTISTVLHGPLPQLVSSAGASAPEDPHPQKKGLPWSRLGG